MQGVFGSYDKQRIVACTSIPDVMASTRNEDTVVSEIPGEDVTVRDMDGNVVVAVVAMNNVEMVQLPNVEHVISVATAQHVRMTDDAAKALSRPKSVVAISSDQDVAV
ncbi:hypothetical protein D3C83_36180 [compost metagenome]